MEEATYLTKHCSKVILVHRRDELRASKVMQERARKNPKIEWLLSSEVTEIVGEPGKIGVTSVKVKNFKTNAVTDVPCKGVFVAIGHQPNTDLFKGQLDMDDAGYLILPGKKQAVTATKVHGVFAAGDVADSVYRQAVSAAGSGCQAAIDAERFLSH